MLDVLRRERDEFGAGQVHIFGSLARGEFNKGSDIDIASDSTVVIPGSDTETLFGQRSGVEFEIWRSSGGVSFLESDRPHRTIRLRREKR